MKKCEFEVLEEKLVNGKPLYSIECRVCGTRWWTKEKDYQKKCKVQELTLVDKATNYVKSTTKHVVEGAKLVSQEEIDRRFAICKACPLFKRGKTEDSGNCKLCSCALNSTRSHISNKLARESEKCPDKPPRW